MIPLNEPGELGSWVCFLLFWYVAALLSVLAAVGTFALTVCGGMLWGTPRKRAGPPAGLDPVPVRR